MATRQTQETSGPLRPYFRKGTHLSRWSAEDIEAVAHALNRQIAHNPRLNTPAEAFNKPLLLLQEADIATNKRLNPSYSPPFRQQRPRDDGRTCTDRIADLQAASGVAAKGFRWYVRPAARLPSERKSAVNEKGRIRS